MSNIIFAREFDSSKFSIGAIQSKDMRKSAMTTYVVNGTPSALRFQLPRMSCPFGFSQAESKTTGEVLNKNKVTLNMSVTNKEVIETFDKMKEILIKIGTENSLSYFNSKKNEVLVREFFKPNIKVPMMKDSEGRSTGEVNPKYPPMLSFNLYKNDGKINVDAVDAKGVPIDINDVDIKGAFVTPIIQCTGVWIGNNMFGYTWKVLKLRVEQTRSNTNTISFRNDIDQVAMENTDEYEDPELESSNRNEGGGASKIPRTAIKLPDSDEDE